MKVPSTYADFYNTTDIQEWSLEEFREQVLRYTDAIARLGHKANPFTEPALSLYQEASSKARKRAAHYLNFNNDVMEELLQSGEPVDDRRLLWRILAKAKLTPRSEILDCILDGDIVEIYLMPEQLQIFRNLAFFDICSLSVEDLLFRPWYKLTKRPILSYVPLVKMAVKIQMGKLTETQKWNVDSHRMTENFGERRQIDIQLKYLSPVTSNGKSVGCISTNHSTIL